MRDGITGHPINLGRDIHLVNAICAAQLLSGDLPGSGFLVGSECTEGENAAGADPEYPADDPLLSHAQANQGMLVTMLLEKLHHGDVV